MTALQLRPETEVLMLSHRTQALSHGGSLGVGFFWHADHDRKFPVHLILLLGTPRMPLKCVLPR